MLDSSLLKYYQVHGFNPVPINVESKDIWAEHIKKRSNLYQRHLMIPLIFFRQRSVIEFGCNSGENALYLASIGAKLTLVEPNEQVLPRLKMLFNNFGLESNIEQLANKDIASFESERRFEVVIAEGFLNAISNCYEMFLKICNFLAPGGLGIISFDDRYGSLLEVIKQLIFKRICELKGVGNLHSERSLRVAHNLFGDDFRQLKASRPFRAWWEDVLLNPFVSWRYFWTYHNFLSLLDRANCRFYSSSPKWVSIDDFLWYKNVLEERKRHDFIIKNWYKAFSFFITGRPLPEREIAPVASCEVVKAVSDLIKNISQYIFTNGISIDLISYPLLLNSYFRNSKSEELLIFNEEMKRLFDIIKSHYADKIISTYHNTKYLRKLWGTPCHYVCFIKSD